jgi:hypothetical protein
MTKFVIPHGASKGYPVPLPGVGKEDWQCLDLISSWLLAVLFSGE